MLVPRLIPGRTRRLRCTTLLMDTALYSKSPLLYSIHTLPTASTPTVTSECQSRDYVASQATRTTEDSKSGKISTTAFDTYSLPLASGFTFFLSPSFLISSSLYSPPSPFIPFSLPLLNLNFYSHFYTTFSQFLI